jgi:hypothetical protein
MNMDERCAPAQQRSDETRIRTDRYEKLLSCAAVHVRVDVPRVDAIEETTSLIAAHNGGNAARRVRMRAHHHDAAAGCASCQHG